MEWTIFGPFLLRKMIVIILVVAVMCQIYFTSGIFPIPLCSQLYPRQKSLTTVCLVQSNKMYSIYFIYPRTQLFYLKTHQSGWRAAHLQLIMITKRVNCQFWRDDDWFGRSSSMTVSVWLSHAASQSVSERPWHDWFAPFVQAHATTAFDWLHAYLFDDASLNPS